MAIKDTVRALPKDGQVILAVIGPTTVIKDRGQATVIKEVGLIVFMELTKAGQATMTGADGLTTVV